MSNCSQWNTIRTYVLTLVLNLACDKSIILDAKIVKTTTYNYNPCESDLYTTTAHITLLYIVKKIAS